MILLALALLLVLWWFAGFLVCRRMLHKGRGIGRVALAAAFFAAAPFVVGVSLLAAAWLSAVLWEPGHRPSMAADGSNTSPAYCQLAASTGVRLSR